MSRLMRWVLVGGTAIALLVVSIYWCLPEPGNTGATTSVFIASAKLECPQTIELGTAEHGQTVSGKFEVQNSGSVPLVVEEIRTACSCQGVERETGANFELVRSFVLDPGEKAKLRLRFVVLGVAGQPMRVGIILRTNDPDRPEYGVQFLVERIRGGIVTVPAQIALNTVSLGETVVRRMEVRDSHDVKRSIKSVRVHGIPGATGRFSSPAPKDDVSPDHPLGQLVGYVDISFRADALGTLGGTVDLESNETTGRTVSAPIYGEVVNLVRLAPSALQLPIRSGGDSVFTARCLVRSVAEGTFELKVSESPMELDVTVTQPESGGAAIVQVTVKQAYRAVAKDEPYRVKLRATVGDRSSEIELPIRVVLPR